MQCANQMKYFTILCVQQQQISDKRKEQKQVALETRQQAVVGTAEKARPLQIPDCDRKIGLEARESCGITNV